MIVVYRHDRLIDFGCWFSTKEAIRILYHVIRLMLTLKASISKAKICVYITPILTRFECAAIVLSPDCEVREVTVTLFSLNF